MALSVEELVEQAQDYYDVGEDKQARTAAVVAIAVALAQLVSGDVEDDAIPAGPIMYDNYGAERGDKRPTIK